MFFQDGNQMVDLTSLDQKDTIFLTTIGIYWIDLTSADNHLETIFPNKMTGIDFQFIDSIHGQIGHLAGNKDDGVSRAQNHIYLILNIVNLWKNPVPIDFYTDRTLLKESSDSRA